VAPFLSAEWIAELAALAATSDSLRAAADGARLVVQQVVTGDGVDGDGEDGGDESESEGEVCWWLELGGGAAAVHTGRAPAADVTFTTDRATAGDIAAGRLSAQTAFMTGRLHVSGNVGVLLDRRTALSGIGDVFGSIRPGPVEPSAVPMVAPVRDPNLRRLPVMGKD
jgi:SCP-2 sterol transfer family